MTRTATLVFLAILLIVILIPAVAVSLGRHISPPPKQHPEEEQDPGVDESVESRQIRLYRAGLKEVISIDLEEYLVGVVLAEMPASFEKEALKAQAVIARTYTLHQVRYYGGAGCSRSPSPADICSDSTHCQAWLDPEEAAAAWWSPEESEQYLGKVKQAVRETAGEVVVYQGSLIEAVYHSACGGKTEASHAIWSGGPVPYLQSISCPYCADSPDYRREILIPFEQFTAALQQDLALPVAAAEELLLQVVEETPGGRVGVLKVNDSLIAGKDVRRLLDLFSTAFTWELRKEGLLFITRGHGHGVGLCQYGANGAAVRGKTYRQIIAFYYPGTSIARYNS